MLCHRSTQSAHLCYRLLLSPSNYIRATFAAAASSSRTKNYYNNIYNKNNKPYNRSGRGRLANPKQVQRNDSRTQHDGFMDDELVHDRDFDYFDHKQQWRLRKINEKYGKVEGIEPLKSIVGRKRQNALFEDDEDDLRLADAKRNNAKTNKQMINRLHQQFEKEQKSEKRKNELKDTSDDPNQTKQRLSEERIDKKKNSRTLIPLPFEITEENRFDILNQTLIPYYKTPYHVQLKQKYKQNVHILRYFGEKIRQIDGPVRVNPNALACPLEPVRTTSQIKQYRNKDEFSVWPGVDGNSKTVGFFVGQHSVHDRVVCVEPDEVHITKQSHIELAKKFQHYLREVSPYDYCQNYGEAGHWRRVNIRSNQAGDHMLTGVMHPQDLTEEELREEMDRLRNYFSDEPQIKSLYFHPSRHTGSSHTGEPYYHLAGDLTISERLFDKHFAISPSSFFQVNTAAAEVLYRVVMTELNANKSKTTLLDLCCGTGTLSVLMANHVKNIIAIDSSKSAIEDAKRNATANDVHNITFHNGTVEDILPQLTEQTDALSGHVVAVANPSRRALHPNAIRTLRRMGFIQKLVYVSCKPDGHAFENFVQLCRPRGDQGPPFIPVSAVPVDLFPYTTHCELVLTFDRLNM